MYYILMWCVDIEYNTKLLRSKNRIEHDAIHIAI